VVLWACAAGKLDIANAELGAREAAVLGAQAQLRARQSARTMWAEGTGRDLSYAALRRQESRLTEERATLRCQEEGWPVPEVWLWRPPQRRRASSESLHGTRVVLHVPPVLAEYVRELAASSGCEVTEAWRRLVARARQEQLQIVDRVICPECLGCWHRSEVPKGRCPDRACDAVFALTATVRILPGEFHAHQLASQ
jgi:hypothetical protein